MHQHIHAKPTCGFRSLPRFSLVLIILMLFAAALPAQPVREDDDFAYIVELYYSGDAYLDEVSAELEVFGNRYPDSNYSQYILYLKGNIALKRGEYDLSSNIYKDLLQQELHPDILADIQLNYAITNYYRSDYPKCLKLLDELERFAVHPWYLYQVNVWRGRIKARQELWFSAAEEYQKALAVNVAEVRFDYFQTLLALEREDQVTAILDTLSASSSDYMQFHGAWLDQLLSEGRYTEFEEHAAALDSLHSSSSVLTLLRTRKALELGESLDTKIWLELQTEPSDLATFYRALLLKQNGYIGPADSLFKSLLHSPEGDIAVQAYLERLKGLRKTDPASATNQLEKFMEDPRFRCGDTHFLLGEFKMADGEYLGALHNFIEATNFRLDVPTAERVQILAARCYYEIGQPELSSEACNRYLNNYPDGRYRDLALFFIAKSQTLPENARLARLNYEKLLREHPDSAWAIEARFELSELHFLASEYPEAEALYQSLADSGTEHTGFKLRLAQTYFYQDKYAEASQIISSDLDPSTDFEAALLQGGISFSQKDYENALDTFTMAGDLAITPSQKTEALSYQAYTLYYLKRYAEASKLFQDLSRDSLNADIYLYQAAKAAAAGRNWVRALELYDRWLDEFPESDYFLSVLADIANTNFNLGRYSESLTDWLNILKRFTNNTYVEDADRPLLAEVFTGIETCSRKLRGTEHIDTIANMIDSFKSDYIKFELEYILVKLYADAELWEDLLREASQFRASLGLPRQRQNEFDQLLLQSLIKLNRLEEADSLATMIQEEDPSRGVLVQWAELAELNGKPEIALERYQRAYAISPDADVWLRMVELSAANNWPEFDTIWKSGSQFQADHPQTQLLRVEYFFHTGSLADAKALADSLLDSQTNPWIRAGAEIWLGRISLEQGDYHSARRGFQKIRLLYQDFPEVHSEACHYYIISLVKLGETHEARLALTEYRHLFSDVQADEIEALLNNGR